jgi:hypothetical protein
MRAALGVFLAGMAASVGIYATAKPPPPNPFGYDSGEKAYLRQMEVIGGKANVLAAELREWFDGLWHGKNLAYTTAAFTVLVSLVLWLFATHPLPEHSTEKSP